jgi:methylmalonyl-CoA mutase
MSTSTLHVPANPVRFVTAASLFDGHDAAINVMRRILQSQGAEVIHLGHDRSVEEVAQTALQEDVQGVAISSYQGGHVEYFSYLVERLRELGLGHIHVYGGGGGVISPEEIELLHARGVRRIFSPEDGQRLGLQGMINLMIAECDFDVAADPTSAAAVATGDPAALARTITLAEAGRIGPDLRSLLDSAAGREIPVVGITGTGGAGKSSLTDELVLRFRLDLQDKLRIAVLAVDPTRRRGGGALLGDRIRMTAIDPDRIFFRSLATRDASSEVPPALSDAIAACKAAGFDLVIVETPGIGQGDAGIIPFVDHSVYVMTPEFGAASQLEKIDMLDFADVVVVNKFERRGAEDARRDVARQLIRNREAFGSQWEDMPVFGTSAARFNDDGVTALYHHLVDELREIGLPADAGQLPRVDTRVSTGLRSAIPRGSERYLSDIADAVRTYHVQTERQTEAASRAQRLRSAALELEQEGGHDAAVESLRQRASDAMAVLDAHSARLLETWPATLEAYSGDEIVFSVRDREVRAPAARTSLSGNRIPRVALPTLKDDGSLLSFLRRENLPGRFPYTAGTFELKRDGEAPARMFAGEGDASRTNRRFKLVSEGQPATRLSTAFDSVTLYGRDPGPRPDIYGKVGTSGVSIATLENMRTLYSGFDLCDPTTSVSMTINGPAPTILAMFLNTAIDQQVDAFVAEHGRQPDPAEHGEIRTRTLRTVRGTIQADILKEDQGQNTCIFSTEFSLRCMADVQEWFIDNGVRNFYSVSISGYHIAEAGANPISQLAFTLANGFTYVESYLARGMDIDDFAPNLSFFFSNGMDPEYTVIGRVARRIWSIAMRDRYGANERSQKLKYHVQTSGRSLHAQEIAFNDIRTTLQALCAIYDNANSLHTNAYDEAVTTPTDESVRRALAIQLIIDQEWGLSINENPLQGSFIIDELTDLVERAVLDEFDRISERGGVLGAMETGYQRGRIQDESMLYEQRKHDGSLPIIGVNTFRNPSGDTGLPETELVRGTEEERQGQLRHIADVQSADPGAAEQSLERLRQAAMGSDNVFAVLMDAVRHCTLGQITEALFEVGGRYRRNV